LPKRDIAERAESGGVIGLCGAVGYDAAVAKRGSSTRARLNLLGALLKVELKVELVGLMLIGLNGLIGRSRIGDWGRDAREVPRDSVLGVLR
jgi:hypothetical protein